jgi:hypothetical protein
MPPRHGLSLSQRPSEAKFVTIRVGEVEEPFAPFSILRWRVWTVARRNHARMERVNVGMVEDNASPPRPISLGRLSDEIEIICSSPKTRKRRVITTMNDLKSQHAIEADSARHIVGSRRIALMLSIIAGIPLRLRSCGYRRVPEGKAGSNSPNTISFVLCQGRQ